MRFSSDLLDQVELLQETLEGRRLLREHIIRERDPALVRAFKDALQSYACTICDFDFAQAYGPIGNKFIEAHHVKPLGGREDETTTKISDLIAVCSNCHRMLHRKSPPYTATEIQKIIEDARTN